MRRGIGNRRANAKDVAAEAKRQDRRAQAVRLRIEGLGLREIGAALGISYEQARLDIDRGLEERGSATKEQMRSLANGALDAVLEGHLGNARNGDDKSAHVVVKAVATHAQINGYAAPKQVELTGKDGGPVETSAHDDILSRLARLAAAARAGEGDRKPDPEGSGAPPV